MTPEDPRAPSDALAPTRTLADVKGLAREAPESTLGGQQSCIVCFASERTHVFAPCGHLACCAACAQKFVKRPCPICREDVTFAMKMHIA